MARTPRRWAAATLVLSALVLAAVPSRGAASACWAPPVVGRVADPFRAPACRWCAGNRGIEYAVGAGTSVRAVATGVVTYSGVVAGTRYVVIDIGAGRRVTYGRLSSAGVRLGDRVVARTPVGTASGTLFFGLRVHGAYTDPASLIGVLVGRPRLIPSDGGRPRPAPPPSFRCGRR
jgi:murein DD-endopeptidase MepM/ murein hydrolase activator NlpD